MKLVSFVEMQTLLYKDLISSINTWSIRSIRTSWTNVLQNLPSKSSCSRLSVTVPSHMPYLYFDYEFWGGIVMWGIICFIIESIATRLRNGNSIINICLFMLLTRLFFSTPIGSCFMGLVPAFEWLIILYLFRNRLFQQSIAY